MADQCDVLIVGGGPAGSSCAWGLRGAGLDVLVIDKRAFPRDKPCAGWITPPVLEMLEVDASDYAAGHVMQPITGFGVCRMGGPMMVSDFGEVVSYGIRRCEFDAHLLRRAPARFRGEAPVKSIERAGDRWLVNGTISTPVIVGAGGHFCPVARLLGARPGGPGLVVAAQEVEFELSERQADAIRVRPEVPELYFCRDLQGYGWCVRKGRYLNVGLGREESQAHGLGDHVQRFVQDLQRADRAPAEIPVRFAGHAYTLYGHAPRRLTGDGMLLTGDAAGLAARYSGEGIRAAVESGLLAAEAILAAAGDYRRASLERYENALVARFGRPERGDGVMALCPSWLKQALAGRLFASRWFTRDVVVKRWFLGAAGARRAAAS